MKIRTEKWESTKGRTEIHHYVKGTDRYIFGYNPSVVSKKQAKQIMKIIGKKK